VKHGPCCDDFYAALDEYLQSKKVKMVDNIDLSQEDAAVLSAIRQVREITGFGKVVVEIKDGRVIIIEISSTVLIKRSDGTIISSRGTRPEQSE